MDFKPIFGIVACLLSTSSYAHNHEVELSATNASYGIVKGSSPSTTYSELVMGPDVPVHNVLHVFDNQMKKHTINLDVEQFVFEGLAPFIADLDGDNLNEVIVTETDKVKGASLAVYGFKGGKLVKIAQNNFLGKRPQWLSKAGVADFDGDNINEIAVVEKPHGGNVFAVWKLNGNKLVEVANLQGPTNHIEGTNFYQSKIRSCNGKMQVLMSDHDWFGIYSLELNNGGVIKEKVGNYTGPESILGFNKSCK
ncbi:hypothetical protein CWN98_09090 [Vibrio splendidus]|uniref:FG-GAP repeat domain-containing protein n=1 Tax=Vibrio splendidus TaxID=29497 RepID=UPI000D364643|nr:VCBS repeat-containing protein [Vibrio splendidus]PTO87918.1 hypothetical protein CWN98_09090 [Vibrio splendidus]PTP46750.1 hypothetical protein CWO10_14780 [Vibrio splendidus]